LKGKEVFEEKATTVEEQLVLESVAMAKFAFASGLKVPGELIETLELFTGSSMDELKKGDTSIKKETDKKTEDREKDIKQLIVVHTRLARIVEPAKPRTILLLDKESRKKKLFKFLGVVPFIRHMMMASLLSLGLFILISLSSYIDNDPATWNLFKSNGLELLVKELFLLSAAGLGASFAALFKANRFIVKGTFDPRYVSSYWIRFFLGIIAGMLLATLIPLEGEAAKDFGKPLLAMLGGFSAEVVYKIFARLIEAVASMVRGDQSETLEAKKSAMKAQSSEEDAKNKMQMASDLLNLSQAIQPDMKPEDIKKKVEDMIKGITDSHGEARLKAGG